MWEIVDDEFRYEETTTVDAPVEVVYQIISSVEEYHTFLSDIIVSESEPDGRCHMVVRAGPLRVDVRTQVTYERNRRVAFEMIEGPPVERILGSWEVLAVPDGKTQATFRAYVKAGSAGAWLLKTIAKYVERKGGELVETFRARISHEGATRG